MTSNYEPQFEVRNGQAWLVKYEKDDNYLFRATKSISLRKDALEKADMVEIHLPDGKVLIATKKEIIKYDEIHEFHDEVKYYYPVELWKDFSEAKEPEQKMLWK
jgi:hypothetical protein